MKKEVSNEQYDKICTIVKSFVEKRDTYNYDFSNLLLAKTKLKVKNENRFFCSEFVAFVLSNVGINVPNIKEKIRPIEFCNLKGVKVIYKGDLKEWCKERKNIVQNKI